MAIDNRQSKVVETNVRLRAVEPEDVGMMYRLENEPQLWAMGCTTVPYSRHALMQFVEQTQADIYADRQVRLVIEADGEAVGCADLFDVDARNRHAELALGIVPEHRGRGIGAEAARQLVEYATVHLGLLSVRATTSVSNVAMQRVLTAAGFTECGRLDRWLVIDGAPQTALIYQTTANTSNI